MSSNPASQPPGQPSPATPNTGPNSGSQTLGAPAAGGPGPAQVPKLLPGQSPPGPSVPDVSVFDAEQNPSDELPEVAAEEIFDIGDHAQAGVNPGPVSRGGDKSIALSGTVVEYPKDAPSWVPRDASGNPLRPIAGSFTKTKDGRDRKLPPEFQARKARLEKKDLTSKHVDRYLAYLEMSGLKYKSSAAAGFSYEWLKRLRADPTFSALEEAALESYRDSLCREAHRRAVEGVDEPVIGGKDKDRVVAVIRKYSDRLLELMLKRHIPEFREKWEGEVKVTGGVLVAPASAASVQDWQARHNLPPGQAVPGLQVPLPPVREIVEQAPEKSDEPRDQAAPD